MATFEGVFSLYFIGVYCSVFFLHLIKSLSGQREGEGKGVKNNKGFKGKEFPLFSFGISAFPGFWRSNFFFKI